MMVVVVAELVGRVVVVAELVVVVFINKELKNWWGE
jgi:hypothetical protein